MKKLKLSNQRTESFFDLIDYGILIPVILITFIGLYVLNIVLAAGYGSGDYPSNLLRQGIAVMIGFVLAILICLLDIPTLRLLGYVIYAVALVLLLLVKVDGYVVPGTGADSWVRLPLLGSFQPSELAKAGIALTVAEQFAEIKEQRKSVLAGLSCIALLCAVPLALIITEPDFGTAFVIVLMITAMLFVWGLSWRWIIGLSLGAVISLPLMWFFFFAEYQKKRILTFLFPGHNAADDYHIKQALAAIRTGGLTGSKIDTPVPVKESDFIFTAVAEYLGFIGIAVLLLLIVIFMVRSIKLAVQVVEMDWMCSYVLVGLLTGLAFHYLENMGMNIGLLPITGIPLPFVSYGGSSMIVNYISLGIILNVAINFKQWRISGT